MKLPVDYTKLDRAQRRTARLLYVVEQNGKCSHCGRDLWMSPAGHIVNTKIDLKLFPDGFLSYPVHLHHNHTTGMTIGVVHAKCNAVLWQWHGE